MPENALVPVEQYSVVQYDPKELQEIIQENIGSEGLTEFDLDRITVPAGGGTMWEVPTLEGSENVKAIEGVVVLWKSPRAYWKEDLESTGGGTPPDCASDDGLFGIGDPGGECAKCPFARFGSDSKSGRGQACKQFRLLFMVRPTDLLPLVVACPPTSIRPVKRYFLRLASQAVPFYGVITRLELTKTKNKDGISYSEVVPSVAKVLSKEERAKMKAYSEQLRPALERVQFNPAEYTAVDVQEAAG